MWTGFSTAAAKALQGNCVVALSVQVFTESGVFLQDITYALTAGQVVEDETASIRRTCRLTLNDPSLVPSQIGDLLHPLSGNELYIFRGVWLSGAAAPELAPLGIFGMSQPTTDDSGDQIVITVNGNDRSASITAHPWTTAYTAAAGQTVPAAIQAIITAKWTGIPLTFNMYPSTVVVPAGFTLGIQFSASGMQNTSGSTSGNNDPWADCVALAQSAGCELFFDRTGVVTLRQIPEPGQIPAVVSFAEGSGCTVTEATRVLDESNFHNGVILIGTGVTVTNSDGSTSPGVPVVATVYSSDPYVGSSGPLGMRPAFITDQIVSTYPQALAAATAQLSLVLNALDTTTVTAVENPALDAGDPASLTRARMGLAANVYIIQQITHPLDAVTAMTITNRPFAVTA